MTPTPPVCDYEGSDYQRSFWDKGGRKYEDLTEAIALKHMLPNRGQWMLELGAGAGRNTLRYSGFKHVVLLDYSISQLEQARQRLGRADRYLFVAGDIYRLPFRERSFDAATMIRALHHMADARKALEQVRKVLQPGAVFILEFANKKNLKSILRFLLGRQAWSPFTLEPVEFARLNFDFHPRSVHAWLKELGLTIEQTRTLSHFRMGLLKQLFPANFLAALDGLLQPTGEFFQLTPSVFLKSCVQPTGQVQGHPNSAIDLFACPACGSGGLNDGGNYLHCRDCGADWAVRDGIYDFRSRE